MAVLVEAISVIVRRDAISEHFSGGLEAFARQVPNGSLCMDDKIVRTGFLSPAEVEEFVEGLLARGLLFVVEGKTMHVAIVDQQRGPLQTVPWLEYARLSIGADSRRVAACWFYDGPRHGAGVHMASKRMSLATPDGWRYEGSLSADFQFRASSDPGQH